MIDTAVLLAEATQLIHLLGPPPDEDVSIHDEDLAHWEDRHEMAADLLALVADYDVEALRAAAQATGFTEPMSPARVLLSSASLSAAIALDDRT